MRKCFLEVFHLLDTRYALNPSFFGEGTVSFNDDGSCTWYFFGLKKSLVRRRSGTASNTADRSLLNSMLGYLSQLPHGINYNHCPILDPHFLLECSLKNVPLEVAIMKAPVVSIDTQRERSWRNHDGAIGWRAGFADWAKRKECRIDAVRLQHRWAMDDVLPKYEPVRPDEPPPYGWK